MKKTTQQFNSMLAGYEKLAAQLMASSEAEPHKDPVKLEWAAQEGFKPAYDPNTDTVTWVQQPKPAYDVPDMMNLQGSMSPERLAELYPAFAIKQQAIDPLLQKIITSALNGDITQQRAQELVYQLAQETYKNAWDKSPEKGAASTTAGNFEQTLSRAAKGGKVAG